jgi:predicted RNA binding protein YcfA (HicA-like mRNA interferase family)
MKPVTGKAFAHALEHKGWRLCHTRGSHHYYTKPGATALVCVPARAKPNSSFTCSPAPCQLR